MKTSRLEAFSDGVLAIIITIMVLAFKTPEKVSFLALKMKKYNYISLVQKKYIRHNIRLYKPLYSI